MWVLGQNYAGQQPTMTQNAVMEAVHRPTDGELVGFVQADQDSWWALAVLGIRLRCFDSRAVAEAFLAERGLAVLAERWWLRTSSGWRIAALIEAAPGRALVRLGLDPNSDETVLVRGDALADLVHGVAPPDSPSDTAG